jgi:hypothetical protein
VEVGKDGVDAKIKALSMYRGVMRPYPHPRSAEYIVAVSIPIGVWHTVHALESGTCILEMKNGAYEPLSEADVLG